MEKQFFDWATKAIENYGLAVVIVLFFLVMTWKLAPKLLDALKDLSSSWRELAVALQSLKDEIATNRQTCTLTQGLVRDDITGVATRIVGAVESVHKRVDEIHDQNVKILKGVETLNQREQLKAEIGQQGG